MLLFSSKKQLSFFKGAWIKTESKKTDFDDKKPSRETLICVCQFRLKAFGLQGDSFLFSVSKENIRLIKNFPLEV